MLNRISRNDPSAIVEAAAVVKGGGILVYPTDTLYGLGVDATSQRAVKRLNRLKGRSGPVSVVAADRKMVRTWAAVSSAEWERIEEKLGGATTVILPVRPLIVCKLIMGDGNTLGIRIPDHPFGPGLVAELGRPITSTSVNRTGDRPLNNPDDIEKAFGPEVDLLVDGGPLPTSGGSTIFRLKKGHLVTVRS